MDNGQLPELPNDLEIYLDKPYGGLFADELQIKIIEEIVADPYGNYRLQYFEEMTGASPNIISKALNNLLMLELIEKDDDSYKANLKSKKLVALTLLSFACIDDRDGSECMNYAILEYYDKVLKVSMKH